MTKRSGLGQNFYIDGYNLSGDTGSATRIGGGSAPLDVTGIDKSGFERIGGLRDGSMAWTSWFNPAASQAHPVLSTLPSTDRICSWLFGVTLGQPAASIVGKQLDYTGTRGTDGSFTFGVEVQANSFGIEFGHNLTGDGTDGIASQSSAGSLTGFDDGAGAATDFGLQLYAHLFSFTGTSITIKIQDSNDNGAGDAYADVTAATTGALTAIGATRVQTSRTENVKQWLRVTTTGTFSAATFAVVVVRNKSTVVF